MSYEKLVGKKHTKDLEKEITKNPDISAILTNTEGEITGIIESKQCQGKKKSKKR